MFASIPALDVLSSYVIGLGFTTLLDFASEDLVLTNTHSSEFNRGPAQEDSSTNTSQISPVRATSGWPADIRLSYFEALGLHVISNAQPHDIIPDTSFLPPIDKWNSIAADNLLEANDATRKPLSNGNLSPGVQTYRERENELLIDNTAAFRTIRRIPPPTGESAVRLGNAYEFFKNLEFFSGYWDDTSLPLPSDPPPGNSSDSSEEKEDVSTIPFHQQTHTRTGTGSQLPPDCRQHLLTAFIKLVAYDFGCNVSFPRCEPRLHLTPPSSTQSPPSYFNSSATFIYRTPTERSAARAGIVEGPVAAISCRASTVFATEAESQLDLAREVVAVLLTAQQRAREGKTESRLGEGKWWTTKQRWGGGPGGPIGREADKVDELAAMNADVGEKIVPSDENERSVAAETRRVFGINGPSPIKRSKRGKDSGGNMAIYENYRKLIPPSSTWDRRARYSPIGKENSGQGFDDVFLVSALNHHISIIRVRVPDTLLTALSGDEAEQWERLPMWRSKWYDLFLAKERVESMQLIWGMISYLMRKIEDPAESKPAGKEAPAGTDESAQDDKMDVN
ncbi:hypothetical protein G7Y89_g160 [Cudoniella acicularis]|uniref:Uncharacterized protein n=1 Tax=Cudoniella acicularis TaxID=354080 RepID=A0A8H4W958_9HELO|nr:hypothetical protein G7Y89_g160 [Cudoniella acicularis]